MRGVVRPMCTALAGRSFCFTVGDEGITGTILWTRYDWIDGLLHIYLIDHILLRRLPR